MAELKRSLGVAECVFFGVGSILGAGIYTLIGKVAGSAGNLTWLAFLVASLAALFTAFSYAELSAALPKAGGEYVYASKAFGKKMGIFLGTIISLNGIVSGATVSVGFAGYFNELTGVPMLIASLGIIAVIFGINAIGIRESSTMNIIFTLIEAGGLLFVIFVAFPSIGNVNYLEMPEDGGINSLLMAGALAFFAFMGFEEIVKLAEETREPEKNIPKALFIATAIVVTMYSLVAICVVSVLTYQELGASKSPLSDVVNSSMGRGGVLAISIIALFATSNTILSNMLGSSRVLLNMAKETPFLKKVAYVAPKRKTPLGALVLILVVMAGFALIGDIEIIARITTVFIFITFIFVNLSVIILRVKDKKMKRPYRIPLNINDIPIPSILGVILTLLLLGYTIYSFIEKAA